MIAVLPTVLSYEGSVVTSIHMCIWLDVHTLWRWFAKATVLSLL